MGRLFWAAGSQCYCDHQIRNQKEAGADPKVGTACSKNEDFPNACHGGVQNPSGCACTGRPADACGGFNFVEIYELHCSGEVGVILATVLLVSGLVYIVGGAFYGRRTGRRATGGKVGAATGLVGAHPHYSEW